ncbi:hypothetical protein NDU88_004926 [Pleurodeles waltl]|uniref:V-SNARE coiled-coil homology domain-containing protein n=1 Tax=Pleurodeles waltl TaxID=8319 RepID=A0AAV7LK31_PLEWA|nr:hypothetical protein NDU88_004926 [Pleurodeles waltl]
MRSGNPTDKMVDQRVRGLQQEVDEIGSLLVGTVQQVNERTEQVPEMMDRLQNLTADCERFHQKQIPEVSTTHRPGPNIITSTSTSASTRCKVTVAICLAVGLIMIILISVVSIHATREEDKGAEEAAEPLYNFTKPGV